MMIFYGLSDNDNLANLMMMMIIYRSSIMYRREGDHIFYYEKNPVRWKIFGIYIPPITTIFPNENIATHDQTTYLWLAQECKPNSALRDLLFIQS